LTIEIRKSLPPCPNVGFHLSPDWQWRWEFPRIPIHPTGHNWLEGVVIVVGRAVRTRSTQQYVDNFQDKSKHGNGHGGLFGSLHLKLGGTLSFIRPLLANSNEKPWNRESSDSPYLARVSPGSPCWILHVVTRISNYTTALKRVPFSPGCHNVGIIHLSNFHSWISPSHSAVRLETLGIPVEFWCILDGTYPPDPPCPSSNVDIKEKRYDALLKIYDLIQYLISAGNNLCFFLFCMELGGGLLETEHNGTVFEILPISFHSVIISAPFGTVGVSGAKAWVPSFHFFVVSLWTVWNKVWNIGCRGVAFFIFPCQICYVICHKINIKP